MLNGQFCADLLVFKSDFDAVLFKKVFLNILMNKWVNSSSKLPLLKYQ